MKREAYLRELEEIARENNGFLRPEAVVGFAKDPKTALHKCFTWDNTEAAHQWRLQQARQLIRVSVTLLPGSENQMIRAFVSLKDDRYSGQGYRQTIAVMSDEDLRQTLLKEAQEDMKVFMARYASLKDLAGVIAEMKKAVKPSRKMRKAATVATA